MSYVPAGFIVGWPGGASIPSGWERAAELDAVHPKGAAASADPGTAGGAATHTHVSPSHTHTVASHQHTGGSTGSSPGAVNIGAVGDASKTDVSDTTHTHTLPASGAQTATLSGQVATFATASHEPPYYTVRWIRSLGTTQGVPDGALCYWDAAVLPSGWTSQAATRLVYLKGAAAGGNGGSTGGSASSHSHAGVAHTHTFASHTHTGGTTGAAAQDDATQTGSTGMATLAHTHTASYASSSGSSSGSATSAATGSETAEPPYVKLGIIRNDNGADNFATGVIGLWLGLLTALPGSLALCDGTGGTQDTRGKYVKGADVSGADFTGIGDTGGAATHDHTDPATHTHDAAHTHSATVAAASASTSGTGGALQLGANPVHGHDAATSGSGGGTSGATANTVDVASNDPPYMTVAFVKFTGTIDVTVTSPTVAQELTAPTLTATWTLSAGTQTSERVRIYASDQATVVYDSGVLADATASYAIPSTAGLRTGNTYYLRVSVVNNSGVPGDSALVEFTTNWTPPTALAGLTARVVGGT